MNLKKYLYKNIIKINIILQIVFYKYQIIL